MTNGPIQKIKFHSINRDIKRDVAAKRYKAKTIAAKHHVTPATVSAVRRAGTWPQYEADKRARLARTVELAKNRAANPSGVVRGVEPVKESVDVDELLLHVKALRHDFQRLESEQKHNERRIHGIIEWVDRIDNKAGRRWWHRGDK